MIATSADTISVAVKRGAHVISLTRTDCVLFPGFSTIYEIRANGDLVGSATEPEPARFLFSMFAGLSNPKEVSRG